MAISQYIRTHVEYDTNFTVKVYGSTNKSLDFGQNLFILLLEQALQVSVAVKKTEY